MKYVSFTIWLLFVVLLYKIVAPVIEIYYLREVFGLSQNVALMFDRIIAGAFVCALLYRVNIKHSSFSPPKGLIKLSHTKWIAIVTGIALLEMLGNIFPNMLFIVINDINPREYPVFTRGVNSNFLPTEWLLPI